LFLTANSFPQWLWQNPLPQGNSLQRLEITSVSVGYTVGQAGSFLKTVSPGTEWNVLDFPSKINLEDLSFVSNDIGWVIGQKDNQVELFRTFSGGLLWEKIYSNVGDLVSVYFFNEDSGWMSIDSLIYFTTDAGNNWQPMNLHKQIVQVYFTSTELGWALSTKGIFRTTNGGSTWLYTYLGTYTPFLEMEDIQMENTQIGWALGNDWLSQWTSGVYIFKTTDGGENWDLQYYNQMDFVDDIEFYNENLGWFITHNNHQINITTDGGNNWDVIGNLPFGINEVKSVNDSFLWGIGIGGYIITSGDSGATWQHQTIGTRTELKSVYFLNENYGYMSGRNLILKTTNRGKQWEEKPAPFDGEPKSIWFIDTLTGIASCRYRLFRTTDGGNTWATILNFSSEELTEINFINENVGWVGGHSGKIYKTLNGGIT
jgi:photosystem II stability/assembly factor-like uncharacterized protein